MKETKKKSKRSNEPGKRGVPSHRKVYAKIAKHTDEIIGTLYNLMVASKQDTVRVAAANSLLARLAPILKQIEHKGNVGHQQVLTDKEYEATLRARGIDPKTGRKIGVEPTKESKGS